MNRKEMISKNVQNVEISGIRKFYNKVSKYPGTLSLTLGQPDFPVPKEIKEGMIKAINDNKTAYTSNAGIVELREEISKYLKIFDIKYSAEETCITVGGSEGLMDVFMAVINAKDKVLVPTPAYPAYESCVKLLGGEIINYPLNSDFSINFDKLESLIVSKKPKVIVISFPTNPTGAVLSEDDRDKLYNLIKDNDIIAISDEMYAAVNFVEDYYSICQYEDIKEKVILVSGFSKMFSATGLRIGYVCAQKDIMEGIMKVHQYNVSCAPSIVQWGTYEGLKKCNKDVLYMKEEFRKRRDYLYNRLKEIGFEVSLPLGAFYMFPSIKKFNISSEEFCDRLLKEGGVAIVPGTAFGKGGEGYIRISYAYSMEVLEEACNRIQKFIDSEVL